jgi:hypothetical protein
MDMADDCKVRVGIELRLGLWDAIKLRIAGHGLQQALLRRLSKAIQLMVEVWPKRVDQEVK